MKARVSQLVFLVWYFLPLVSGIEAQAIEDPVYEGKPLSVWADEVLALNQLAKVVNTNHSAVQAMLAIGTNAIPWLLAEMAYEPAPTNRGERPDWQGVALKTGAQYHQLRARACFWALGEVAKPAIPGLVSLLKQQPDLASSSLAGIGVPALPALERLLTAVPSQDLSSDSLAQCVGGALGGLFVAIDVGRIPRSQATYLLPAIQVWTQSTNGVAEFWANGVAAKLSSTRQTE